MSHNKLGNYGHFCQQCLPISTLNSKHSKSFLQKRKMRKILHWDQKIMSKCGLENFPPLYTLHIVFIWSILSILRSFRPFIFASFEILFLSTLSLMRINHDHDNSTLNNNRSSINQLIHPSHDTRICKTKMRNQTLCNKIGEPPVRLSSDYSNS